jgi:hypothetical protein
MKKLNDSEFIVTIVINKDISLIKGVDQEKKLFLVNHKKFNGVYIISKGC